MKKKSTYLHLLGALFLGLSTQVSAQFRGNSNWDTSPKSEAIIIENFQDWGGYTDKDGYGQAAGSDEVNCSSDYRNIGKNQAAVFDVNRTLTTGQFTFYLDLCVIQPECDTKSGTLYTIKGEEPGSSDNIGPSIEKLTIGSIMIYDNYGGTPRPSDQGYLGDGRGSLTTCKIPYLEEVRFSNSSFGGGKNGRGFKLEIGREKTDQESGISYIEWEIVRQFCKIGNTNNIPSDEYNGLQETDYNASAGWLNAHIVEEENVYLRWSPSNAESQVVRIHDIALYGEAPVEIVNPYSFAAPPTAGLANTLSKDLSITLKGNSISVSEISDILVFDALGRLIQKSNGITESNLPAGKGSYLIKAKSITGRSATKKIIL